MKAAVIGGSFDPVHNGHLYIGEELRKQRNYEKIFYIPTFIPPHKQNKTKVSPLHRLEMLSRALKESEGSILDCEILRGGVSYTLDTINFLFNTLPITGKIGLVIGDDLVPGFKKWYRWQDLITKVDIIVAHRISDSEIPFDVPHSYLSNLILPLSSETIRKRIEEDKAFRYLVPEAVYHYISDYGLYKDE